MFVLYCHFVLVLFVFMPLIVRKKEFHPSEEYYASRPLSSVASMGKKCTWSSLCATMTVVLPCFARSRATCNRIFKPNTKQKFSNIYMYSINLFTLYDQFKRWNFNWFIENNSCTQITQKCLSFFFNKIDAVKNCVFIGLHRT